MLSGAVCCSNVSWFISLTLSFFFVRQDIRKERMERREERVKKTKKKKEKAVVLCCNFWWFVVNLLSLCLFCTPDSFFWVCSTQSHSPCNKKGVSMSCYTFLVLPPFGPLFALAILL